MNMSPKEVIDAVLELGDTELDKLNRWLERGDGVAVYMNIELGHPQLGHKQFVSFGSPDAQLEMDEPPERLPDIGNHINWRYYLQGTYRGAPIRREVLA